YTPTAALRVFEQGQIRLSTAMVMLVLSLGGFAVACVWLHTGRPWRSRGFGTGIIVLMIGVAASAGAWLRPSWDLSETRRHSFSRADETALGQIRQPLRVTVFLAAEDPRLMDLERSILSKLQRILPRVEVDYAAHSRSGLFEGSLEHY